MLIIALPILTSDCELPLEKNFAFIQEMLFPVFLKLNSCTVEESNAELYLGRRCRQDCLRSLLTLRLCYIQNRRWFSSGMSSQNWVKNLCRFEIRRSLKAVENINFPVHRCASSDN